MYCGHENEDTLVTCAVCGNRLGAPVPTQEPVILDVSRNAAGQPDSFGLGEEPEMAAGSAVPGEMPEMAAGSAGSGVMPEMAAGSAVPGEMPEMAADSAVPGEMPEMAADSAVPGEEPEMAAGSAGLGEAPERNLGGLDAAPERNPAGMDQAPETAFAGTGEALETGFAGASQAPGFAGAAHTPQTNDVLMNQGAGMAADAAGMGAAAETAAFAAGSAGMAGAPDQYPSGAGTAPGMTADEIRAADEAMVTQEPAFAGQIPVNSQFGETTPAGQFYGGANTYPPDRTPGYGEDWRQDVGRGQTYGARTQYEARREARRSQGAPREGVTGGTYGGNGQYGGPQRDQYGSAGYGYRQPQGMDPQGQGGRPDYGRREGAGGSKMFMVRARKRVKSVTFFLMALAFTAMFALNVYNIYCGNALRNITESDVMLANILSGTGTNFFTQMLTELASQLVKMVVNVQDIVAQLGKTVELIIAVVFLVPNILYCLALWLMFFRTDIKRRQFPMGGYTLARVMMILKFLIACLVLAIGLVISVYFVVVGAQRKTGSIDSSLIQGVILLIVMIVLSVFVVMYYIQWMFCLKVVRDNAKKGTDPGRMPGFVVVLSVLCTGVCVALMIPMAPNDYVGLAARGAAAAYFLISGLWVLIYKIRVKRT